MERETKIIKLPSGKEAVIKTYLTARERNELRGIYLANMNIETESGTTNIKEIKGDVMESVEKKLLELGIINFDSSTENIIDRLLDGTPEDYDSMVVECNKINTGGFQKPK